MQRVRNPLKETYIMNNIRFGKKMQKKKMVKPKNLFYNPFNFYWTSLITRIT